MAIKRLLSMTDATGELARWRLRLFEFEFDAVHRTGVKYKAADALSLFETVGGDTKRLENNFPVMIIFAQDTQEESLMDDSVEKD